MSRPDVQQVLSRLKSFQRRTVEHAFHRLFVAPDSSARFLVSDEVGLGKTLVARGVIARAIDHLWDSVKQIDIIYICSNQSIASSNLPKLRVGGAGERSFALATRLTMLATELAGGADRGAMSDNKLNFISFTPATSFAMGNSGGKVAERVLLYQLLAPQVGSTTALKNVLQGGIKHPGTWREHLDRRSYPIEPGVRARFVAEYESRPALGMEFERLRETWFGRWRENWPEEARRQRNRWVGKLRALLANVCIEALEPDLIILDEFQRFKALLETRSEKRDPAAELAQSLFRAKTPEGQPVRTLLLSATPYKLYTTDAEIEHEDHYADFLGTTRFLMGGDEARVDALQRGLARYGGALKRAAAGGVDEVAGAKSTVEDALRAVMARTERVGASEARDAMVEEPRLELALSVGDVRQYLAADALFRVVGAHDPIVFWKSAPYLAHFMRGYKVNQQLAEAVEQRPGEVARVLREHAGASLTADALHRWEEVDPAHAKLREILRTTVDEGLWRLLWMPPTVPYWPLEGAYAGTEGRTKTLLFSAWNVVPDVVSGLVSYEAERLMVGERMSDYREPGRQQRPLLRLTDSAVGGLTRHRLMLLLLPCLSLADEAHPLSAPEGVDRREWVAERVAAMLSDPRLPDAQDRDVDRRWEWAAPMLLDPGLRAFLVEWQGDDSLGRPNPEVFGKYVGELRDLDPASLGRRPEGLAELLTEVALGSPAVLAARTAAAVGVPASARRRVAVRIAQAFWRLFNRPAVITLLNQLAGSAADTEDEDGHYWQLVLRYCRDGNLQAVLDETWHLAWEQHAWADGETIEATAMRCATQIAAAVEPSPSRVHAGFLKVTGADGTQIASEEVRLRTDFALRFGDIRTDEGVVHQDAVRSAFNSPFRPFLLASTSVGQEGLDFHPWCHRLVHWNLPGNPVDLEQREGRIHRYKGHAVRKNVADQHALAALAAWQPGRDLWRDLFQLADDDARRRGDSDLVPHWMAPGPHRVQRHVPMLPYTKEVEAFRRLKRQLAAYRVVFGQPRQEELVTLLDQSGLDVQRLRAWAIDLAPPELAGAEAE